MLALSMLALLPGCEGAPPPVVVFDVVDREDGARTPRTAACDELDPGRCLLPWPSSTFTVADPDTATGVRLAATVESLHPRDDASSLAHADGFSRVSPLLAHFEVPLDESTLAAGVRLVLAQHDHPDRGRVVPLRVETITLDNGETLLLADPREPLEPAADYVVVIDDALSAADGSALSVPHGVSLALRTVEPLSDEEADLVGYHAPTRRLLTELEIDPASVLRVWDFTTRSAEDARRPLRVMRDAAILAVDEGAVAAVIDRVEVPTDSPAVVAIVHGHLTGLPTFLVEDEGFLRDDAGDPAPQGTSAAPFRVVIPAGDGDYRFVMYGHGTGGNERDDAFDAELAEAGVAKVGMRLYGWTDSDVILTFTGLSHMASGSFSAAAFLVEALAHAAAIERAMAGVIADALSADELLLSSGETLVNPGAGRRPDGSIPMWVGGSLGGTTGLIYAAVDPAIRYAVVNVPGAAWSQWVWQSATFDLIHGLLLLDYDDDIDLSIALTIGQTNLDLADGAVWSDVLDEHPTSFLIQESMGDPILPNPGTEMVAITSGALHVGGVLEPILGIETASEVIEGSAITQFRAPSGGDNDRFDIHGFAARGTLAGVAAREQILDFVSSAFAGESRIAPPASCPDGCDYGP